MSWLDRLLGRPDRDGSEEREQDEQALDTLRTSMSRVRVRTDRILADYALADKQRMARRKP